MLWLITHYEWNQNESWLQAIVKLYNEAVHGRLSMKFECKHQFPKNLNYGPHIVLLWLIFTENDPEMHRADYKALVSISIEIR